MSAITDLDILLGSMSPCASDGQFVFCCIADGRYGMHAELAPVASFQEQEGLTLVLPQQAAERAGLAYEGVFAMITLNVHSSLAAVGLTAAVAAELTKAGISANVLAACFHDHIFVPAARASEALAALNALAQRHAANRAG
ncbi:ACT domain-containing protein [Collimonas pratensis]|uniref:ACT domain protein n=1 Tax=Collimonas pratensis TaxID=279113 RepID=A0ABN4M7L4_9BURK|nr:ACT domain-containing protein [Collimonas pratensis]AMP14250.1 ACT domain protein [Collimonas pratensis]